MLCNEVSECKAEFAFFIFSQRVGAVLAKRAALVAAEKLVKYGEEVESKEG